MCWQTHFTADIVNPWASSSRTVCPTLPRLKRRKNLAGHPSTFWHVQCLKNLDRTLPWELPWRFMKEALLNTEE
jgi:hypothetical protein